MSDRLHQKHMLCKPLACG